MNDAFPNSILLSPAGPVFPPHCIRPYRARAKISLNNRLKSRFIRVADSTNTRQFAANVLTIRSTIAASTKQTTVLVTAERSQNEVAHIDPGRPNRAPVEFTLRGATPDREADFRSFPSRLIERLNGNQEKRRANRTSWLIGWRDFPQVLPVRNRL